MVDNSYGRNNFELLFGPMSFVIRSAIMNSLLFMFDTKCCALMMCVDDEYGEYRLVNIGSMYDGREICGVGKTGVIGGIIAFGIKPYGIPNGPIVACKIDAAKFGSA